MSLFFNFYISRTVCTMRVSLSMDHWFWFFNENRRNLLIVNLTKKNSLPDHNLSVRMIQQSQVVDQEHRKYRSLNFVAYSFTILYTSPLRFIAERTLCAKLIRQLQINPVEFEIQLRKRNKFAFARRLNRWHLLAMALSVCANSFCTFIA